MFGISDQFIIYLVAYKEGSKCFSCHMSQEHRSLDSIIVLIAFVYWLASGQGYTFAYMKDSH